MFNVVLLWSCLAATCGAAEAGRQSREAVFRTKLEPLLRTYCYDCHDVGSEIPLADDDSASKIASNRKAWVRALAQVRIGSMPPAEGDTMDDLTRAAMAGLIDDLANAVDCVTNPNAGKVALRRLNRFEYRNTVRDLTGVDYAPAADFPGDDVGYGFDNIGDVLSLPPLLVEKYLTAAEAITGRAIWTPPPPRIFEINRAATSLDGAEKYKRGGHITMTSDGAVRLPLEAPFAGRYAMTIRAAGDQGGGEPVKMEVRLGSRKIVVDVPEESPADHRIEFPLRIGKHAIELAFVNDLYIADKVDRNLHLYHIAIEGTESRPSFPPRPKLPPSHHELLFVTPGSGVTADAATGQVIGRFASRAFRRPATLAETKRLVDLAGRVRAAGGSFAEACQVAMSAVLVSPKFLFKVEQPRRPGPDGEMPPINEYELATRISYFLWSSMPDDELLLLAHRGKLRDPKTLLDKVGRMIADPRSNRFVKSFAGQWLQLRNLELAEPDPQTFREFDDEIAALMRRETLTFFADVMKSNQPITRLLDADYSFMNAKLAKYYGINGVEGREFRRVPLGGTQRGGLLTHGSILTVTSNPTRTSPVKRGRWILENLLNTPPPPPPPDIPELDKRAATGTLRERLEQHRENPACAACHDMMDPLGFALENFDAVGRWRDRDGRDPIDASGKLADGTSFAGPSELRDVLLTKQKRQFVRCLAEKMLVYAVGRGTEYYDKCAIDKIVARAESRDLRFAYLILAVIQSDPFQKQGFRE